MKVDISRDEDQFVAGSSLLKGPRSRSDVDKQIYRRDKCCVCIDMRKGVTLIGIFIYIDFIIFTVNTILQIFDTKVPGVLFPMIYGIAHIGMLFSMMMYFNFWRGKDTFVARSKLSRACLWVVITQFLTFIVVIVGLIPKPRWIEWIIGIRIIVGQVLYFFIYIYCMGITKRYAH